jgi:hypothetical protein
MYNMEERKRMELREEQDQIEVRLTLVTSTARGAVPAL